MSEALFKVLPALMIGLALAAPNVSSRRVAQPQSAKATPPGKTLPSAPTGRVTIPGDHLFSIQIEDRERRYYVHVPLGYDGRTSVPVVVVLHGEGESAPAFMKATAWYRQSNSSGFLAVFPEALSPDPTKPSRYFSNAQTWNDGAARFGSPLQDVDDLGYLEAVMKEVVARFGANPKRVYVAGFSNGGSMALLAALALPDKIAAVACVAGYLWQDRPKLRDPVPLLYIVGTDDPLVPLKGGRVRLPGGRGEERPAVGGLIAQWAGMLGCPPAPARLRSPDGVTAVRYGPGKQGSEVVYYRVTGMGHTWPGGRRTLPERLVGKTSAAIRANNVIWDFFQKHASSGGGW